MSTLPSTGPASTKPQIRPAARRDLDAVLELWLDLIEHHRRLDPQYPSLAGLREVLHRELSRALAADRCQILVAAVPEKLCGFLLAEIDVGTSLASGGAGSCWIHELYVVPDQRRSGLGRALVTRVERFFESHGGGRRCVRVETRNAAGIRFWKRAGFTSRALLLERHPDEAG